MKKFVTDIAVDQNENVTKVVYEEKYLNPVIKSMYRNNTFFPAIRNIVKNGSVVKMFFEDDTSVHVRRSPEDPDNLAAAIAFCVFKRLFGKPNEKGEIDGDGFTTFLKKTIHNKVFDQGAHDAKEKAERERKQAEKRRKAGETPATHENKKPENKWKDKKNSNVKRSFPKAKRPNYNRSKDCKFKKA